ncbi:phosphatase PAP2 family protein [Shewanella psychrotolerans]|uniref:phosphatase PAP2 family protein n=1 Tax=Shewanella psychrotolerans TaxID=2864206 RepID=UPI001C656D31|nr:phosphatase PAP2 family protein [Shewanella psychrotolerans]QYK01458.1 phosphatase PAP2 family protein [Shewanella psychrotolerans]
MSIFLQAKAEGCSRQNKHQGRGFLGLLFIFSIGYLFTLESSINLYLFRQFNGIAPYFPDWSLTLLTDLGNGVTLGLITLCFVIKRPELIIRVLIASVLSLIIVPTLKQYFDAPRPAALLEVINIVGETRLNNSFPSGHTATAFLFAGTLFFAYQCRNIKTLAIGFAAIVGLSRIIVGAHWPLDIIMGAFVGLFCAYFAAYFPYTKLSKFHNAIMVSFLWLVLLVCELEKSFDKQLIWQVMALRWGLLATAASLIWYQYDIKDLVSQRVKNKFMAVNKT